MWRPFSQHVVIVTCLFTLCIAHQGQTESIAGQELPEKVKARTPGTPLVAQTAALPATLPADLFTGTAHEAYQVAAEIPEILNELNCHCGCKGSQGHANLLHCFTDGHAAG